MALKTERPIRKNWSRKMPYCWVCDPYKISISKLKGVGIFAAWPKKKVGKTQVALGYFETAKEARQACIDNFDALTKKA